MKKIYTYSLMAVMILSTVSLSAQRGRGSVYESIKLSGGNPNAIWIIGVDSQNDSCMVLRKRALDIYQRANPAGFQESGTPNFIISDKNNRAIFAIGGFVNMRTAYDWNSVIGNRDFVTYNIPTISTPSNEQRILMDPTTSRLFFKTIVNTDKIGKIEAMIETDFRGTNNALRLRKAYISFLGLTIGQTTTTFVDLNVGPNTIDFQGPNSYTYNRTALIRYKYDFNKSWTVALAAEMPIVSGTPATHATIIPQRVPDIPAYVQYNWNGGKSHVRASGIVRTMFYHDDVVQNTYASMGWGAQLSANIAVCRHLNLYGMALYGKGISNYMQDLNGNGMDLVSDPHKAGQLTTLPAFGWLAGAQLNLTPKWQMNLCYSQVNLWDKTGYLSAVPEAYRFSQYFVTNLFYNILPSLQVGVEYLYGTRYDVGGSMGKANRAQMALQFNF